MQLSAYLHRIGVTGPVSPDLATLYTLHRAHLLAIPYENLDIHFGRRLLLDEAYIYTKLVSERRGGWCYEMNGLFAWALRTIGFRVHLLGGTVNRAAQGDGAYGNHLMLYVEIGQPGQAYLADVGFGNGFREPLPLAPGTYHQGFLSYTLALAGDRWHFSNHAYGGPGYDLTLRPHRLEDFASQCNALQTEPTSGFVRNTSCHRFTPEGLVSLRGAVLSFIHADGIATSTVTSADDYVAALDQHFDLQLPQAATLWPQIWSRHQEWLSEQAANQV